MNNIGKEYGTALFALACEGQSQEEYALSLETVEKAFEQNPDYAEFLSSPSVPLSERLASLDACFGRVYRSAKDLRPLTLALATAFPSIYSRC